MSYVALATERFDEVTRFYGETLGLPSLGGHDRPNGRGRVFDLHGLRLDVLDATHEPGPMRLGPPGDRMFVVAEVHDVEAVHARLPTETSGPEMTLWGARVLKVRDPDGVAVWFLQWAGPAPR
jgi:catechol 2,3-dioxygenase-like lactoylglutathione lyase family enzyme